jgi:hypothetical protein
LKVEFTQETVIGIKLKFNDQKKLKKFKEWLKDISLYSINEQDNIIRISCNIDIAEMIKKQFYYRNKKR